MVDASSRCPRLSALSYRCTGFEALQQRQTLQKLSICGTAACPAQNTPCLVPYSRVTHSTSEKGTTGRFPKRMNLFRSVMLLDGLSSVTPPTTTRSEADCPTPVISAPPPWTLRHKHSFTWKPRQYPHRRVFQERVPGSRAISKHELTCPQQLVHSSFE